VARGVRTPSPAKEGGRTVGGEGNEWTAHVKGNCKKYSNSICVTRSALCIVIITDITRYYYVFCDKTAILMNIKLIIIIIRRRRISVSHLYSQISLTLLYINHSPIERPFCIISNFEAIILDAVFIQLQYYIHAITG
jgi:hypothetical protein